MLNNTYLLTLGYHHNPLANINQRCLIIEELLQVSY